MIDTPVNGGNLANYHPGRTCLDRDLILVEAEKTARNNEPGKIQVGAKRVEFPVSEFMNRQEISSLPQRWVRFVILIIPLEIRESLEISLCMAWKTRRIVKHLLAHFKFILDRHSRGPVSLQSHHSTS